MAGGRVNKTVSKIGYPRKICETGKRKRVVKKIGVFEK